MTNLLCFLFSISMLYTQRQYNYELQNRQYEQAHYNF